MSHLLENWGRFNVPSASGLMPIGPSERVSSQSQVPVTVTQSPIVTGTSVLGVVYKDGVMMAADCLASYGSLARFRDMQRLSPIGTNTLLGSSGDISDLQYMLEMLQEIQIEEYCWDDGSSLAPWHYYHAIAGFMYNRRSEINPLWNSHVVAGVKNGKKFLGYVDLLGTRYTSLSIATGFGAYLAQPLLRNAIEARRAPDTPFDPANPTSELTFEEAKSLLETCMRVLYYRDARSLNKIQLANITEAGVQISQPYIIDSDWSVAEYVKGYN